MGVSTPGAAAAQDRDGFYAALELGVARGVVLDTDVAGVNHPTRCDRLLCAAPADAPVDAVCTDDSPATLLTNSFSARNGFAGAVAGSLLHAPRGGRFRAATDDAKVAGSLLHAPRGGQVLTGGRSTRPRGGAMMEA